MRYMGSKGRHAKSLVPILMDGHSASAWYVEPFCGGGNILAHVPSALKWGNDTAIYAVALLGALSEGWMPPENISNEEYIAVKAAPNNYAPEYVGFVGYCCSYAGKLWGGFARGQDSKGRPRNYAAEQVRYLRKQAAGLSGCRFSTMDYRLMDIPSGATVYMDPPYADTTKYSGSTFDTNEFWKTCRTLSDRCRVFVSEYAAPTGWECMWEKGAASSLTKNTGKIKAVERLFRRAA